LFFEAIEQLNPENIYNGTPILQQDFRSILAKSPEFFDVYVRIVFSGSGFNQQVYELVTEYNQEYGKKQPIILICGEAFKETDLYDVLIKKEDTTTTQKKERESKTVSSKDFCVPAFSKVINSY
jgi:hypothetical protein